MSQQYASKQPFMGNFNGINGLYETSLVTYFTNEKATH